MNEEKYNQIIDEAYENYSKEYEKDNSIGMCLLVARMDGKKTYRKPNKEMFVGLCTHDKTFSEKRGLKIEEKELSLDERKSIYEKEYTDGIEVPNNNWLNSKLTTRNIPTKLITITYNDKKIESYENNS
jgi:hypothetical protein